MPRRPGPLLGALDQRRRIPEAPGESHEAILAVVDLARLDLDRGEAGRRLDLASGAVAIEAAAR